MEAILSSEERCCHFGVEAPAWTGVWEVMSSPTALVTCGPSYEPLDAVRCLTNHSTGELGTLLCGALLTAGFSVTCFRGDRATAPAPPDARVVPFGTNLSLQKLLEAAPRPDAIFHAAALCDFVYEGEPAGKIRSNLPEWRLVLHPAVKILPLLRPLFPEALLVGWKYEVEGTRNDVLERGRHQIVTAQTDACVVNGPAYGTGLGVLNSAGWKHCETRPELCQHLAEWARACLA